MRVYIPSIYRTEKIGGKEIFCKRLAKQFEIDNIFIAKSIIENHDVTLQSGIIKYREKEKTVFRADGVYHNIEMKYDKLNNLIKKTIEFSDALVYQSNFSKRICEKYLGKFKGPSEIIFNGCDPKEYDNIVPFKSNYRYNFLTSSKWRPHKRLKDIIECFKLLDVKESCLYVAGDLSNCGISERELKKYKVGMNNLIFLGNLDNKKLLSYIKMCDCFVHLCWIDSCPNGVIEAIAAKKPIITNNVGGTKEIVEPSGGIICDIDSEYNLQPCLLYSPPAINRNVVVKAMDFVIKNKIDVKNDHVDIKNIANKYIDFFKFILRGKNGI